jgi:hypothetical protein
MPQTDSAPRVHAFLQRAFRGRHGDVGIFSRRELGGLLRLLDRHDDDPAAVGAVVTEFRAALRAGKLLTDRRRRERIDTLFERLAFRAVLPDDLRRPGEGEDWVDALLDTTAPEPAPEPTAEPATEPAAHSLGDTAAGALQLDGSTLVRGETRVDLTGAVLPGEALELVLSLLVDTDPSGWTDAARAALAELLSASLSKLEIPETGHGKLRFGGLVLSQALLLARVGGVTEAAADAVSRVATEEPRPAIAEALCRALEAGGRPTPVLESPRDGAAVLDRIADLLVATPEFAATPYRFWLSREHVAILTCGLSFCGGADAADSLFEQLPHFALARESDSTVVLDDGETQALVEGLEAYIDDSKTAVFQFGLWSKAASIAIGNLTHADAVAPWIGRDGTLFDAPPRIGTVAVSRTQVPWLLGAIHLIRDRRAADDFAAALRRAADAVSGDVLSGSAAAALRHAWEPIKSRAEGNTDGRADLGDYPDLVDDAIAIVGVQAREALASLADAPPSFNLPEELAVVVDAELATFLADVVRDRAGSARSLPNIARALTVFATDLAVTGEAARDFQQFLQGYFDTWPDLDVFDFNKLERLARAHVEGDPVPLCRINGETVDPGAFHTEVGRSVKAALQHIRFTFDWIPHRFGYRAKQYAELIDLLAERAVQDKGPLATLRKSFPDAVVTVVATTSDMEYNSLVYRVVEGDHTEIYYLDSAGALHTHARHPEAKHVLFEAEVDAGGHVHVRHDSRLRLSSNAYPLMNTYGRGDRIDVEFYDDEAEERLEAQERFETRYKVRLGTIIAFDDRGNHTVVVETDDGYVERTVTYEQIRRWNNPHLVSETDGVACSVRFRKHVDDRFEEELTRMVAVAAAHGLPEFDLSLSETALATVQKAFLRDLNRHTQATLSYPRKPPANDADAYYWDHLDSGIHPSGEYLDTGRGICRHQFIHEHMGKQRAGIDERFASGAANTYGGDFRGRRIWGEVSLADRSKLLLDNPEPTDPRYLSDATWHDAYIPLWEGAYGNDLRRLEMYDRTNAYAYLLVRTPSVS